MWSNLKLKENIACKDDILIEYKEIRHKYNNMLQHIVCLIEEEDFEGLKSYKVKLLEEVQVLNSNNFTQLVKLKNKKILSLVYNLLLKCKNNGTIIYLTIYNDIEDVNSYKTPLYKLLEEYLDKAYESAIQMGGMINFKIGGNNQGVRFAFENIYMDGDSNNIPQISKAKRKSKNIFFNTFIDNGKLIQEILISAIVEQN